MFGFYCKSMTTINIYFYFKYFLMNLEKVLGSVQPTNKYIYSILNQYVIY